MGMMQNGDRPVWMIWLVILTGIAVRVFSVMNTPVINPDGMVYIQQAKAICQGNGQDLRSCVPFVSNYPFFIAAAYGIFASWIEAARCVSVFFGSLTLVPLYFMLRCFADTRTACLAVLLYGFIPFLVGGSADVIRDPVCWFFTVSALLLFVKQIGSQGTFWKRFGYQTSSYLLFLMAGWARPEAFIALIVSCLFSLLHSLFSRDKRYVLAPLASLLVLGFFVTAGTVIFDPYFSSYSNNASDKIATSIDHYRNLRQQLETLIESLSRGELMSFLSKVRSLVWLVALGVLVGNSVAGVFYPYIIFFVLGFFGLSETLRRDPRVNYLLMLVILGYVLLFVHVLQTWYFEHRFLHLIIFPACIFAAFGIEKTTRFITDKLRWRPSVAAIMIFLYLAAFGLGKNIKTRDVDKMVYLNIAEYISELEESGHRFIPVITGEASSLKLVSFYLNLHLPTGFCPLQTPPVITDNNSLVRYAVDNDMKYFLWDEQNWRRTQVDINSEDFRRSFNCLKRWYRKDYGDIVLFGRGSVVSN